MALTRDVLRLLEALQARLNRTVDTATADLTARWALGWAELEAAWVETIDELVSLNPGGGWPTPVQLARAQRVIDAIEATQVKLAELAATTGTRVLQDVPGLAEAAAAGQAHVTALQMPATAGPQIELIASFNRVSPAQIAAIVARTTQQVTSTLLPLSADATTAMYAELIRGIALGTNPRPAAGRMVARVQGRFAGGLGRALNIARTEMLDAHRTAAHATDQANADVLAGWQWVAALDARCCRSCWAQHGVVHPLSETGPLDHQQGRCARAPVTKTWRELGFDLDDAPSALPDARATFDALPVAAQTQVLGKEPLRRLRAGEIEWGDLSTRRSTVGWRDSYAPTPVRDLPQRVPVPA